MKYIEFDPSKQTFEQYEGDCGCDPAVGCVPCELCHDLAVIGRLRSENKLLLHALTEIAESTFCSYGSAGPGQYGTGVTDGHRHCSAIAKQAITAYEELGEKR